MRQIRRRTALLAAAALCWGMMFPEYTFTADSYAVIVQEADAAGFENGREPASDGAQTSHEIQTSDGAQMSAGVQADVQIQELCEAVREGRVRYRFRFFEYVKGYFFGT